MSLDRCPGPVSSKANPGADHSISPFTLTQTSERPTVAIAVAVTVTAALLLALIVLPVILFTEMPPLTQAVVWSGLLAASRGSYLCYRRVRLR